MDIRIIGDDSLNPKCTAQVSNSSLRVGIFGEDNNQADITENSLVMTDLFHNKVHKGELFFVDSSASAIGQNVVNSILIEVGKDSGDIDSGLHFRLDLNIEGGMTCEVYPVTSYTGGTTFVPRNFNGNCDSIISPASAHTKTMVSIFKYSPLNLVLGTRWKTYTIGGTGTNQTKSTAATQTVELIFKPGIDWLVRFTTLATSNTFQGTIIMYEDGIQAR